MSRRPLRNRFSWSVTRDRVFETCPRQYWFQYYGAWGAWDDAADARTREIDMLKRLATRHTWIGQVVHDCIRQSLVNVSRGIAVLPLERILEITRKRMRLDFRQSRERRYRVDRTAFGLFEHEYAVAVTDEQWREAAEHVDRCLRTFYASETWAHLRALPPDRFLEIEQFSELPVDDETVTIRLDLATREDEGIVVWDWKTGRREGEGARFQMACYAAYASRAWGVPPRDVLTRRYELAVDEVVETRIGEAEIDEVMSYIRGRIRDMKALLDDPERNVAREERFVKVERPDVCLRCNFLRVCAPDLPGRRAVPGGAPRGGAPGGGAPPTPDDDARHARAGRDATSPGERGDASPPA